MVQGQSKHKSFLLSVMAVLLSGAGCTTGRREGSSL